MKTKKKLACIISVVVLCCVTMAFVEIVLSPNYALKSGIKVVLFLAFPFAYSLLDGSLEARKWFVPKKEGLAFAFLLGVGVYVLILGAYFALRGVFDFSGVTESLAQNVGVNKENFVWVALYISFSNSLLEEFFFRGFAFFPLVKLSSRRFAYGFAASAFALYHVSMVKGWFSFYAYVLVIAGLFVGALLFHRLNEKGGNIYASWVVHMFANFSINTVGFLLFGILG